MESSISICRRELRRLLFYALSGNNGPRRPYGICALVINIPSILLSDSSEIYVTYLFFLVLRDAFFFYESIYFRTSAQRECNYVAVDIWFYIYIYLSIVRGIFYGKLLLFSLLMNCYYEEKTSICVLC